VNGKLESNADRREGLADLAGIWGLLLVLGVALVALGVAAIASSFVATLATVLVYGILLIVGGVCQVVSALWVRRWRGAFLQLLSGVLYIIIGVFMIDNPVEAALGITLLVAVCLLAGGIFRVVLALTERFEGWAWAMLHGFVSIALGAAIWRQWPLSGLWVIGLFVGIEILSGGLSWVALALAARSAPRVIDPGSGLPRPKPDMVS
jgi:uncharacterized membrane protein HdeD (DUF308 family)